MVDAAGYARFVSLVTAGYYYNGTFVQFGVIDSGTRLAGLSRDTVSAWMGVLVLVSGVVGALSICYALAAASARTGAALLVASGDLAAALGSVALVLALELLPPVHVVGGLVHIVFGSVAFGAVLVTYFGWQRFIARGNPRVERPGPANIPKRPRDALSTRSRSLGRNEHP